MNLSFITSFNFSPFLVLLVIGVIIYFAFQIIYRFLVGFIPSERLQVKIYNQLPLIERMVWGGFGMLGVLLIVKSNPIWGTLIMLMTIIAAWTFIKNYLAGLIVVLSGEYRPGQHLRIDGISGKISELGTINASFELGHGEIMLVPYTDFSKNKIVKTSPSEKLVSHKTIHILKKPCNLIEEKLKIERQLLASPWLLPDSTPEIEVHSENDDMYELSISIQGIDENQLAKAMKLINPDV